MAIRIAVGTLVLSNIICFKSGEPPPYLRLVTVLRLAVLIRMARGELLSPDFPVVTPVRTAVMTVVLLRMACYSTAPLRTLCCPCNDYLESC